MEKQKIIRKNIRMSEYLANWYEERANKLGISQSNLMVMALSDYVKQDQAMSMMSNFEYVMQELEELKQKDTKKS